MLIGVYGCHKMKICQTAVLVKAWLRALLPAENRSSWQASLILRYYEVIT
jgi:hypothetical protein